MSERVVQAIVIAAVGSVAIVLVRFVLIRVFDHYVERASVRKDPGDVASLRTRLSVLRRVIVATLAVIVAWQVLSVFPSTEKLGTALLASSAVLAVFAGLAFSVPLGNLGAGLLLGFTQPVRLGDRVSIGETVGQVEQINLIHTVLIADDDRRIFIPNTQMVTAIVVNRTIADPRRVVSVRLPVALDAPLEQARSAMLEATHEARPELEDVSVLVVEVTEKTAWFSVTGFAPPGTNVGAVASELRERAVRALGRDGLLPA
jgi:small-conductance mechanosensitive channel